MMLRSSSSDSRSTGTFVSRGTQTIPLFLPSVAPFQHIGTQMSGPPSLFTLAAAKHLQVRSAHSQGINLRRCRTRYRNAYDMALQRLMQQLMARRRVCR